MVHRLALAFVPAYVEDRFDFLLIEGVVSGDVEQVMGGRGFRQPSLWIRDSQVIPERNALMMFVSTTLGRELHR